MSSLPTALAFALLGLAFAGALADNLVRLSTDGRRFVLGWQIAGAALLGLALLAAVLLYQATAGTPVGIVLFLLSLIALLAATAFACGYCAVQGGDAAYDEFVRQIR